MPTSSIVAANPAPDPARKRGGPFCGTHDVLRNARPRRSGRSLAGAFIERAGAGFIGGRLRTSFGPY